MSCKNTYYEKKKKKKSNEKTMHKMSIIQRIVKQSLFFVVYSVKT